MKALLKFEARLDASKETTYAGYAFDWEGQGIALTPSQEKDMLNEMIEQSLYHWASMFFDTTLNRDSMTNFPSQRKGQFTGKGVKCTYDIYAKP